MKKLILSTTLFLFVLSIDIAQEFPIAIGNWSETYPSTAFYDGKYFTTFLDKRTGSSAYGFYGKFTQADGTVLPTEYELVDPIYNLSFMHEVCWGEANYIFVWSRTTSGWDRDAYAVLISPEGIPQTSIFEISIGNTEDPAFLQAAWDGEKYIAIWQEGLPNNGAIIRGQFIDADGSLIGSNFSIRPPDLAASVSQIYPDVIYNGTNYLVVWDDNRNGNRDVYAQFIDTDGNLIGDDISITTHSADQQLVQLAFGGDNYYAVWADERQSSNDDAIFGQLIGFDGTLIGENTVISPVANSEGRTWPSVAASNSEYLVAWDQDWLDSKSTVGNKNYDTQKYQAAGIPVPKPALWYDIYARKISFSGEYLSDETAICTADFHQQDCNVASDGSDFLVTWSDSRNNNEYYDIYGYLLEGSEVPLSIEFSEDTLFFITLDDCTIGKSFQIINPNSEDVLVDSALFYSTGGIYWEIETPAPNFPISVPANGSIEMNIVIPLPVENKFEMKEAILDSLIIRSMEVDLIMPLYIGDELANILTGQGLSFEPDSLFITNINQILDEETITIQNPHVNPITLISMEFSAFNYGYWFYSCPVNLAYEMSSFEEIDIHISHPIIVEKKQKTNKYLDIDTLFIETSVTTYSYPIHFYTEVVDSMLTSVDENIIRNDVFSIFPNPASKQAVISLDLKEKNIVNISISNLEGKLVKQFSPLEYNTGQHKVKWNLKTNDGYQAKPGIYFCHIVSGNTSTIFKLIITN